MRHPAALAGLFSIATLSACAHAPEAAVGPPDYASIATSPAPNARLYADCIAQAATNGAYGRAYDEDTELVLFTCRGAPARAFYDGLAARSAEVSSKRTANGRTWRSTNPVQRNLFGVDWCATDGREHECVISLNAGDFLKP